MTSYDEAVLALLTGTAVTPEHVDEARRLRAAITVFAEDLEVGARYALPEAPVAWCSEAGTAYAEVLVGVRTALDTVARRLTNAGFGLSVCSDILQTRLDDLNAALASRPLS